MTKIVDLTGNVTHKNAPGRADRIVDPSGRIQDPLDAALDLPQEGAAEEIAFPPMTESAAPSPEMPDPRFFSKELTTPARVDLVARPMSMSEVTKQFKTPETSLGGSMEFSKGTFGNAQLGAPRKRLTHNEMLEEVIGSRDLSNQTKFYLISKLGREEETSLRASTESEELSSSSKPAKSQKGNKDA